MNNKFYEGQSLVSIFWAEGIVEVGKCGVSDIVVVMENGEMAGVPWAIVTNNDGSIIKYNLKLCEGCRIK